MRLRLLGRLAVEVDGVAADEARLGELGRIALAYLALERRRPVPRDELADVLWGDRLPPTWGSALRGVISRVRSTLAGAGLPAADVIRSQFGCYQLHLPAGACVDVEEATSLIEEAERGVTTAPDRARRAAAEGVDLTSHPLLPGATGGWVEQRQRALDALRVRALEALAVAASEAGDQVAAVAAAERAVELAPLRESAHQRLMTAHARAGNRGAALKAYQRCRDVLAEELGVSPSAETEAIYLRLLGDEPLAPTAPEPGARPPAAASLPASLTSFVGRRRDVEELRRLLRTTRLLTLTGPGGVGKSRLAVRVAEQLIGEDIGEDTRGLDGVWLIELASLAEPSLVPQVVLSTLGVPEAGGSAVQVLTRHVADRRVLLVLDNCEHLVAACAELSDALLRACPALQILATSREPIGVVGETVWAVPSLSMPDAVELFRARAAAGAPGMELDAVREDVERICAHVDGIPLAIELAAARTRVLSVPEIASRLDDRLRLLVGGPRTSPPRHQTLRAAIDWSVTALPDAERAVFARLSVFAGGFTIDAAESVCTAPDVELVDALGALVDKSLVAVDRADGNLRYRMLETLRQYADELLDATGEKDDRRERHLGWAVALVEAAEGGLEGREQRRWLIALDAELANLRAALDWTVARGRTDDGLRLASSLVRFWEIRGYFTEGRLRIEALVDRGDGDPARRAKALNAAAVLAQRQGDAAGARGFYQESLVIRRALGDRVGVATALHGLANLAAASNDLVTAQSLFTENLAIARELGRDRMVAASLMNLGVVAQYSFMHGQRSVDVAGPEAAGFYRESLECYRRLGDRYGEAMALENLGALQRLYPGDPDGARALHEQSLAIRRELGDKQGIAASARYVAALAIRTGEITTARQLHHERMEIERELGNTPQVAEATADLAEIALGDGDVAEAHRVLDRGRATFEALGSQWWTTKMNGLLGDVARREGRLDEARLLLQRTLVLAQELKVPHLEGWALVLLARLARAEGDLDEAVTFARGVIALAEVSEMPGIEALALDALVGVACDRQDFRTAALLAGAAHSIRAMTPFGPDVERDGDVAAARAGVGGDAFETTWAEGAAMTAAARRSLAQGVPTT